MVTNSTRNAYRTTKKVLEIRMFEAWKKKQERECWNGFEENVVRVFNVSGSCSVAGSVCWQRSLTLLTKTFIRQWVHKGYVSKTYSSFERSNKQFSRRAWMKPGNTSVRPPIYTGSQNLKWEIFEFETWGQAITQWYSVFRVVNAAGALKLRAIDFPATNESASNVISKEGGTGKNENNTEQNKK